MQKIIKIVSSIIIIFILVVFYLSLNRSTNYNTENLVGKKLTQIKLESFENKNFFTNETFKRNNFTLDWKINGDEFYVIKKFVNDVNSYLSKNKIAK